jgi:hypothetical protein
MYPRDSKYEHAKKQKFAQDFPLLCPLKIRLRTMLVEPHDPVNLFISPGLPLLAKKRRRNGGRKVLGKKEKTLPFVETIFQEANWKVKLFRGVNNFVQSGIGFALFSNQGF